MTGPNIEPKSEETDLRKSQNLIEFVRSIRQIVDQVDPKAPIAGQLPVTADMFEAISRDGPKATLFALIAVAFVVMILFRRPVSIFLTMFSLILGIVWMMGFLFGTDSKINFLSFIALPITFGIGVDYGVNMFQRLKEEKDASIVQVIENTGGAVLLASLTTAIGYGSLLIADNRAFVSFGKLAVIGEVTCVFAAVFSLPAFLLSRRKRMVD
jgi:predicted RND superfamily exporter protein